MNRGEAQRSGFAAKRTSIGMNELSACWPEARDMEIASGTYPTAMVKERFSKLNSMHLEYVVGCMKSNSQKIGNIKKYVLAALFNAPCTIDGYFLSQVNYDFPQFVGR